MSSIISSVSLTPAQAVIEGKIQVQKVCESLELQIEETVAELQAQAEKVPPEDRTRYLRRLSQEKQRIYTHLSYMKYAAYSPKPYEKYVDTALSKLKTTAQMFFASEQNYSKGKDSSFQLLDALDEKIEETAKKVGDAKKPFSVAIPSRSPARAFADMVKQADQLRQREGEEPSFFPPIALAVNNQILKTTQRFADRVTEAFDPNNPEGIREAVIEGAVYTLAWAAMAARPQVIVAATLAKGLDLLLPEEHQQETKRAYVAHACHVDAESFESCQTAMEGIALVEGLRALDHTVQTTTGAFARVAKDMTFAFEVTQQNIVHLFQSAKADAGIQIRVQPDKEMFKIGHSMTIRDGKQTLHTDDPLSYLLSQSGTAKSFSICIEDPRSNTCKDISLPPEMQRNILDFLRLHQDPSTWSCGNFAIAGYGEYKGTSCPVRSDQCKPISVRYVREKWGAQPLDKSELVDLNPGDFIVIVDDKEGHGVLHLGEGFCLSKSGHEGGLMISKLEEMLKPGKALLKVPRKAEGVPSWHLGMLPDF